MLDLLQHNVQVTNLQRYLFLREHLKYVWNVVCSVTNHVRELHDRNRKHKVCISIGRTTLYRVLLQDRLSVYICLSGIGLRRT